jgi:hypothetical protein
VGVDLPDGARFTLPHIVVTFGPDVAHVVDELSHEYTKATYPDVNRAGRKLLESQRLASTSYSARLIKTYDHCDNLISLIEHDADFALLMAKEIDAHFDALPPSPGKDTLARLMARARR